MASRSSPGTSWHCSWQGRRAWQVALPPLVRAAFSGTTNVVGRWTAHVPPALRAVTAQRAVLTTADVRTMCGCNRNRTAALFSVDTSDTNGV
jgi:hypothetical protein